ncbi:TonB-dependent receptor [Novosphingobium sp. KN65.2]|uniref:TonB-dependent receptor n=1 Tax=Novosphingobium sp. KN65.2 TaxID=1478134 RepID=UPI0005E44D4A|nr:TonB-dependent receptor [Novosphingobium sp. KN65.2]CDO38646.1 putative TonB-dependent receptor [Novosphingobium sp. KN65.2]
MRTLLMCGVSFFVGITPALAQSEVSQAGEPEAGIADIIVTANRREENVQRAALAVQAIDAQQLLRAGVSRPEDISKVATGVQIATGGSGMPQVYIRGVGNYATNSNAEGAIAINVDGVYVSRGWAVRGAFFDLDRVEALKGPQGTLYGRNASGGALNIITKRPVLGENGGYFTVNAGNYDLLSGEAAANVAVSQDLAIRISGKDVHRNGYLRDGYDDEKSQAARAQLLYKPDSDFSLLLSGFYQHGNGRGAGNTITNGRTLPGGPAYDIWGGPSQPLLAYYQAQNNPAGSPIASPVPGFLFQAPLKNGFDRTEVYGVNAEINWNFGPATLTILPAYRYGEHSDYFPIAEYQIRENENDKQSSLEVRLSNQSDKLKWVLGGYYFNEVQANLPGRSLRLSQANFTGDQVFDFRGRTRSYAAFGQATYSISAVFRLTGGLRYTYERKVVDADQASYAGPDQQTGQCTGSHQFDPTSPVAFAPCVALISNDGRVSSNSVTWKAGLEYDVGPRSLLYANVSTGFKSGGIYSAPAPNTFRPEKLTAYELGSKNRFFDNQLQLNLEAFYYNYRDHQEAYLGPTSVPDIFTFVTANAGRAESYGALIDIQFQPTQDDHFAISAQFNKSKYKSFFYTSPIFFPPNTSCAVTPTVNAAGDFGIECAGKPIVRAPEWTGNASYDHIFHLSDGATITAGASVQFSSSYYTAVEFLPSERQKAYATVDGELTYTGKQGDWSISLWGRNLTKEAVVNGVFHSPFVLNNATGPDGMVVGNLKPPRTYGVRARFDF